MTRIALGAFAASLLVLAPPATAQTLGVTVSPLELTIQEGSTGSYTVVLNAQPTATVTISVTASDSTSACHDSSGASCTRKSGVATVDKSSLTFTTTDWNSAQTVTVTATDEDMAGIFKFAQVTHDASGGGYDTVTVREVRVTVTDNDVRDIVYQIGSPGNLQANSAFGTYEGSTHSYYVSLKSEPTEATTVTLLSEDASRVTVSPTSLTFSPTNWNVAQPVPFSVADNDVLGEDRVKVKVTSTFTGSDYDGYPAHHFTITVFNNDVAPETVIEGDSVIHAFGFSQYRAYTIRAESVGGAATVAPASVQVTQANYERLPFTVTGVRAGRGKINFWIGDYLIRSFVVTVGPPAIPRRLTLSANRRAAEGGRDVTITARLDSPAPAGGTEVTLRVGPESTATRGVDYTLSRTAFTIAEGDRTGTAILRVIDDTDDDDGETVYLFADSRNPELSSSRLRLDIRDNDLPSVTLSASPKHVLEGSSVTVTVRLSSALSSDVTIPLTLTAGTAEEEDYGSLSGIEIGAGSTSGTGTISTIEDADFDDETFTVALGSLPSSVEAGNPSSVRITIWDLGPPNEPPTVTASCDPCRVGPGGGVLLTAEAWDPDGDPVKCLWSAPAGRFMGAVDEVEVRWQAPAEMGTVRIRVEVSDGWGGTASAEVAIEVANEAPAFGEPSYGFELRENQDGRSHPVGLGAAVAEDPDGDEVTYSLTSGDGTRFAVGSQDGAVSYVGAGEDYETEPNRYELTVRAQDPHGAEATADVTIDVTNANEAPAAAADTAATGEDRPVTVDVLANDRDVDGDALRIESVSRPGHGTARIAAGGVEYAPEADWHGTDRFAYTVADGNGGTAEAEVVVRVAAVNDAPVAVADSAATNEDRPVTVDVLANDRDVDGDALRIESVSRPGHGTARVAADGGVVYAPAADWHGTDRFTYTVADENGGTGEAEIEVRVAAVNDAPVAVADSAATNEDRPVTVDVLANDRDVDGDALRIESVSRPGHGTARIALGGGIVYAPEDNWHGTDRFTYTAADGNGGTAEAEVQVRVEPVNDAPVAVADSAATNEDRPVTVDVLANDRDPDGDALRIESVSQPAHGTVRIAADGGVVYAPAADWHGTDRFAYRATDGNGGTAEAEVQVRVEPVNDAPVAMADTAATSEDEPVTVDVLANDADPDGDTLRIESVSRPGHGTARIAAGGVEYAPEADWHGTDRYAYTVADGNGGTAEAEVVVRVAAVNDAPVAVGAIPDQALEEGGATVAFDLAPYFEDAEGDALTYTAASSEPNVAAVTVAGSMLTVTPVGYGSASIEVTAHDPDGLSAAHTFAVGADDRMVRMALDETLAATARAHLASARMMLGRRVGRGRRDEGSRLTLVGRAIPLDEADVRTAADRLLSGWTMSRYLRGGGLAEAGRTFERKAAEWAAAAAEGRDGPPAGPRDAADLLTELGVGAPGSLQGLGDGGGGTEFAFAWGGSDDGGRGWRLWGQGDIQTFAGEPAAERGYDGNLRTGWAGLDRAFGESWLAGVALARSKSGSDWRAGNSDGRLETSLTAVHPYLRWSDEATSVWAMAGSGWGSAENARATGRAGTSGLALGLGLLEVRRRFADWFGLRADAAWARLATGDGTETVDDHSAAVRQQRLGIDVSRSMRLGGLALEAFGEASGRHDGGAGQTGTGLELAGGVRAVRGPVRIGAQGRILVLHSARGYEERGLGVTLAVGSPSDEEGLSLSVSPRWGGPASLSDALWEERLAGLRGPTDPAPATPWSLDARAQWALRLPGGRLLGWSGSLDRSAQGWGLTISGGIDTTGPAPRLSPAR